MEDNNNIESLVNEETDKFIERLRMSYEKQGSTFSARDEILFRSGVKFGIESIATAIVKKGININGID